MTFNPNIPQATDRPSDSQAQLLANFQQLNTIFDVDHVTFNASSNNGKHNKSSYVVSGADPATPAGEGAVYTKAVGARTEAFYRYPPNGAVTQLTYLKAWVSFDGTTGAIQSSYNVTNVVRNAAGDYTINFTTALGNANYVVNVSTFTNAANGAFAGPTTRNTNNCRIFTRALSGAFGVDLNPVCVLIVGT